MRAIAPQDLIFEWERVRAGLLAVQRGSGDDWLPEDVYMAIKQGQATLFMHEDAQGDYLGFVVLQVLPTYHSKRLHVWAAYSVHKEPMLYRLKDQISAIARQAGASKITFSSTRHEWERVAQRGGFTAKQTMYETEI